MGRYLLIESRDPFESEEILHDWDLVESLASRGSSVTLFLVQNGVLPARKGSKYAGRLTQMAKSRVLSGSGLAAGLGGKNRLPAPGSGNDPAEASRVTILADDFSLRERGIRDLVQSVKVSSLEELVDLLLVPETKTMWR